MLDGLTETRGSLSGRRVRTRYIEQGEADAVNAQSEGAEARIAQICVLFQRREHAQETFKEGALATALPPN